MCIHKYLRTISTKAITAVINVKSRESIVPFVLPRKGRCANIHSCIYVAVTFSHVAATLPRVNLYSKVHPNISYHLLTTVHLCCTHSLRTVSSTLDIVLENRQGPFRGRFEFHKSVYHHGTLPSKYSVVSK